MRRRKGFDILLDAEEIEIININLKNGFDVAVITKKESQSVLFVYTIALFSRSALLFKSGIYLITVFGGLYGNSFGGRRGRRRHSAGND